MRHGYLPLLAPDVTPERLERCGLFVSIGPAREFSSAERDAVKQFVHGGGTFLCMVGAKSHRRSRHCWPISASRFHTHRFDRAMTRSNRNRWAPRRPRWINRGNSDSMRLGP